MSIPSGISLWPFFFSNLRFAISKICNYGRDYGGHVQGMLQPNNRIRLFLSAVNRMEIKSLIRSLTITKCFLFHGDIILNRSNNSQISIETSAPQQADGFIINNYFGISNITARRQKRFPTGSLANNRCPVMLHVTKICVSYWLSHNN